jgi:hypothetical protein
VKGDSYHNFYAVFFRGWNRYALTYYLNQLIGERNRNFEIYVDGNLWTEENVAININKVRIKALTRKKNNRAFNVSWVANKDKLELWCLNIRTNNNYCKYLTVWSRVTLGYALEIWNEFTKKFPKFDWILYNNKMLKKCDMQEDIINYKYYGRMYLKSSIKGGGVFENIIEIIEDSKRIQEVIMGNAIDKKVLYEIIEFLVLMTNRKCMTLDELKRREWMYEAMTFKFGNYEEKSYNHIRKAIYNLTEIHEKAWSLAIMDAEDYLFEIVS